MKRCLSRMTRPAPRAWIFAACAILVAGVNAGRALSGAAGDVGPLIDEGISKLRAGNPAPAVSALERAVSIDPADASAQCNLAIAYRELGRPDDALASFRRAARLAGDTDARPWEFLGGILADAGRIDEAYEALEHARGVNPRSARIVTALARLDARRGDSDRARKLLMEALEYRPDYPTAIYNLAVLHRNHRPVTRANIDKAVEYFRKYLALGGIQPYIGHAEAFVAAHEPAGQETPGRHTEPDRTESVAPEPEREDRPEQQTGTGHSPAVTAAPVVQETPRARDSGTARKAFAEGLRLHNLGDLAGAVQSYEQAVGLDPDFVPAMYNLGLALKEAGNLRAAADWLQKAAGADPSLHDARYMLALVYRELGSNDIAAGELLALVQSRPDYPKAHLLLGMVYFDQGRKDPARKRLRRYLELVSEGPLADHARKLLDSLSH